MDDYEMRVKAYWDHEVRVVRERYRRHVALAVGAFGIFVGFAVFAAVIDKSHWFFVGTMFLGVSAIFAMLASDDHMVADYMKCQPSVLPFGRRVEFGLDANSNKAAADRPAAPDSPGSGNGDSNHAAAKSD